MNNSWWMESTKPLDEKARSAAQRRQQVLTKPAGSLGELEHIAIRLAALTTNEKPRINRPWISVFAADHGIAAEGVSAFPQAVTAQMVHNYANGGAAISVLATEQNAVLEVVDVGVIGDGFSHHSVVNAKVGQGTYNFLRGEAMTREQLEAALAAGRSAVERAHAADVDIFIGGEMGIGNTTAASALACVFLQQSASSIVGPGTGLDAAGIRRKADIVETALALHGASCREGGAMSTLQAMGGFEIAALAGAYIACAQRGMPAIVDGFIATGAAYAAVMLNPATKPWLIFGHRSAEPAHQALLQALDATPLLSLGMRLGEGSGAAVALSIVRLACALHNRMATFDEAGVSNRDVSDIS